MTDKTKEAPARSALKLALAVLKEWHKGFPDDWTDFDTEAVAAIHEALAEPSEALALVNKVDQEESSGTEQPAIKQDLTPEQHQCKFPMCHNEEYQQALAEQLKRELYTGEPAQRKPWVRLTDEEVKHEWVVWRASIPRYMGSAKGIEAKLKAKNSP